MSASPSAGGAAQGATFGLSERNYRKLIGSVALLMVLIGLVLMLLLTQATNNRELYERYYPRLFLLNAVVASLLVLGIVAAATRLLLQWRRGHFGSRLLVKLAAVFALVGCAPGLLIYAVSYQFVTRSIESWFDVKVEGALDAGLNLGRATLNVFTETLSAKTRATADQLGTLSDTAAALQLERIRDQLAAQDVALWSGNGAYLGGAGVSRFKLGSERMSANQLREVRQKRLEASVEGLEEMVATGQGTPRIRVLALVAAPGFGLQSEPRVLEVVQHLPETMVRNALQVQAAYGEYQERALARSGLQRMYIGTLTLSLVLAVFGAVLLAVTLGRQMATPMLLLAEGVREVAAGDLRPKPVLQGKDELGGLTRSFADMTQQLADARAAVQTSIQQLSNERANLQTILDNLSSGVIVLGEDGVIRMSNPGATRILREPLAAFEGKPLAQVAGLADFASAVDRHFRALLSEREHALDHWQDAFELRTGGNAALGPGEGAISLLARGAPLPGNRRLLVFDDISEIVSAQRAQAWGEVARRLAHEIKNPLTPIQLSAERLHMKLDGKLPGSEQAILDKSVKTIVDQVEAMKRLVNEFRDYARLPSARLVALDLNALVTDILHLYNPENAKIAVQSDLEPDLPPIQGDAEQLRQVIHNLVQNAQDASEATQAEPVCLQTRFNPTLGEVRLLVRDSGPGFPPAMLKRVFEPYVTTKPKGTGLGLAVVKKIADEHGARVEVSNLVEGGRTRGAQVSLSFPVK